MKTAADISAKV